MAQCIAAVTSRPLYGLSIGTQVHQPRQSRGPARSRHHTVVQASGKKGVATFGFQHNDAALADLQPEASWFYTWSASKDNVAGSGQGVSGNGLEYVPMIWNIDSGPKRRNRAIDSDLSRVPSDAKYLLGFNEPDNGDQANIPDPFKARLQRHSSVITVQHVATQAIAAWPKLVDKAAELPGRRLGSPATAGPATKPGMWMETFMNKAVADNLRIDFVCLHWYGGPDTDFTNGENAAAKLAQYVIDSHALYQKPIWLTEFALIDYNHPPNEERYPTEQVQIDFARAAVYKLEQLDMLERYAWYALPRDTNNNTSTLYDYGSGPAGRTNVGTAYKYAHG